MASLPVTEHEHTPTTTPVSRPPTVWELFRGAIVVAVVLLLVGALAWIIFGYATGDFVDADAKRVLERTKILADRNAEDAKLLHDPASWQDKGKGIVRVPIERAMTLAMADLEKVQPHPAYPIKQSPPQPANAPTAAGTKGPDVADTSAGVNPPASNPTVGQPSPAPVAPTPVPAPATSASAPVPPNPAPAPTATPIPTPTARVGTPSPDNNVNNPGSPLIPGTVAQPAAPTAAPAPSAGPTAGSKPEPLMTPPSQPTPASATTPTASDAATPTPVPGAPGASPAGTP